jgi:hypothetical protein
MNNIKLFIVVASYRSCTYFVEDGTNVMTDIRMSLNNTGTLLASTVL